MSLPRQLPNTICKNISHKNKKAGEISPAFLLEKNFITKSLCCLWGLT